MDWTMQYRSLSRDEFRLIALLPSASVLAPLRIQVFHSDVRATQPSYAALSYTWSSSLEGNDDSSEHQYELAEVDNREVMIHENLAVALRSIRTCMIQYIWADALCIDQHNQVERSSQILLMEEIFTNARCVWAWLGRQAQASGLAMDFLERLANDSREKCAEDPIDDELLQPPFHPAWEALRCLLSRKWWKRAWIVQEFALAKEVTFICGDRRITTQNLEAADRLLFRHYSSAKYPNVAALAEAVAINGTTFDPARNLLDLRRRLQNGERLSALATLQMTRLSQASDPRDRLFAKLGLGGRELAALCLPDYTAKPEDVWFAFCATYIRQRKDLYIICMAGVEPRLWTNLPSWLPDWGPSRARYPLCSLYSSPNEPSWPNFNAANGTDAITEITSDKLQAETLLRSRGVQVDTVDGVAGDRWAAVPTYMQQSRFRTNVYGTRAAGFQALCRTVTSNTDRMDPWSKPPAAFGVLFAKRWQELDSAVAGYEPNRNETLPLLYSQRASGFERAWRSMRDLEFECQALRGLVRDCFTGQYNDVLDLGAYEEVTECPQAASHSLWTALEHSAGQACFDRLVFTTTNGFLGLGPITVLPGDIVTILLGCKVPVLLRPDGEFFRLLGECYVDGIMHGEAMEGSVPNPSSLVERTFEIG